MTETLPLSLYIHIPWCEKKCPYCDFNSHRVSPELDEPTYINALLQDLRLDLKLYHAEVNSRELSSIFIGGGTPSLFSIDSFTNLLNGIRQQIDFSQGIEITTEANPGSSEAEKFSGFRQAGINRLSIGVQSFNQQHLNTLGRVHSAQEAINAAGYARQAGFENFNLDLMFGLPDQTLQQGMEDIKQAIKLMPTHLSCYQLTIEPNTLFHHRPPSMPNSETTWELQQALQNELAISGYRQYEVSAYAQDAQQCRHNINYWHYGDYLGIGAGAHGKLSTQQGAVKRMWKIKHPASYLKAEKGFTGGAEQIDKKHLPFEFMINALRLRDGFSLTLFKERTRLPLSEIEKILHQHQSQQLITISHDWVAPTERGRQMLDSMLQDYLT